ncbi:MAG TPA: lysophospholipid acyltransferase family protein [Aldersonia sp.]
MTAPALAARPVHAWMPASTCDTECIDRDIVRAGPARVALRLLVIAALLLTFPVAHMLTPRRTRGGVQRGYARALLGCFGVRMRVVGAGNDGGALLVAGHVGWLDVLAISAVRPVTFVARADLVDWPGLGTAARMMRIIPIDRADLRALPAVVDELSRRLAAGEAVAVFPEGTTWCGRAVGSMRPALFQAAVDAGVPVQPVGLRYLGPHGEPSTIPGFVGDETMIASIRRLLRTRSVLAEVVLAAPEPPGTDRRDLAARSERAARPVSG